mmetsp:Transcript_22288/g.48419  ORF Transcript_22288/g.48419 Transcript_22288/m.48419 type:complete len:591 (+) Transcript_22288:45-1817(+)
MTVAVDDPSLPLSTADVKQQVRIRLGKEGTPALKPKTVFEAFEKTVARIPNNTALSQKRPKTGETAADVAWTSWTWLEYKKEVYSFAKSLLSLGFQPFDIVNIIGFNAPEWLFSNYGAIAAGGVAAGIYATNQSEACHYISEHSKAKVVICDGMKQLEKYLAISKKLPSLKALVVYGLFDDGATIPNDVKKKCAVPIYTYEEFVKLGVDVSDEKVDERIAAWQPGNTCTLIYTSGTTGPPKAVMITNDNITWTVQAMLPAARRHTLDETDIMISYLPLSHIAAQMLDMHIPMSTGMQIFFAQEDALKGSLGATLKEVRPTQFFGVPRVWEKIYEKLQMVAKETTGVKKMVSTWAKGESLAFWDSMDFEAKKKFDLWRDLGPVSYYLSQMLLKKAHEALGLDRCQGFYVSAAPIEVKIIKYFHSIDVPVMELFGQSECTGPHTINTYDAFQVGSVGRPMLGTQTKMGEGTGELIYTGRHIFAGYMGMPEKTKETISPDGWLHSGDIITIDPNDDPRIPSPSGFVKITGRIKELIITAGGENIPPVLIEDELKAAMPAISNAMVVGDKRKVGDFPFVVRMRCISCLLNLTSC